MPFQTLARLLRPSPKRPARPGPRLQPRLAVEPLEDRTVLSAWAAQIGGPGDSGWASVMAFDSAGNSYVAGQFTLSANFNEAGGTGVSLTSAGDGDGFVAKYSPTGGLLWARRFGGAGSDEVRSVAVGPTGQAVYVSGRFSGSADFSGDLVPDATSAGGMDAFILRLDAATGGTDWSRTIGSAADELVCNVAASPTGVYLAGSFDGPMDFDPGPGVRALSPAGKNKRSYSRDAFVLKLDPGGNHQASWAVGGLGTDQASSIVADGDTVYLAGFFWYTVDFDPGVGVLNKTSGGLQDTFLASYTVASGAPTLRWAQAMGGPNSEQGAEVAGDSTSLYLTGQFSRPWDLDPGSGTFILSNSGDGDGFAARYSKADGSLVWARQFGDPGGSENARAPVVVDEAAGVAYLGLSSSSPTIDLSPGGPGGEYTNQGSVDGFLVKVATADGGYLDSWRAGGSGSAGAIRPLGLIGSTVYATGWFSGTVDLPTGDSLTSQGNYDSYVVAFDTAASPLLAASAPTARSGERLTAGQLQPILDEAVRRWSAAGADTSALANVTVRIADLGGSYLGLASGDTVWIDDDAAGWGWFVDPTPWDDSEFLLSGDQGEQNRMDLLTALMHEMGHLLGHDHDEAGVMHETLAAGTREGAAGGPASALDALFSQPAAAPVYAPPFWGDVLSLLSRKKD